MIAKKHLNRNRKARVVRAYMKGVPPTELHKKAVDRLCGFWENTHWKTYNSFNSGTDITFKDELDYQSVRMNIYTGQNKYSIVVHIESDKPIESWYMGATGSTRFMRPTESWGRGNDLPDGKFVFETWQYMLNSMMQFDLLNITEFVSDDYIKTARELIKIARSIL